MQKGRLDLYADPLGDLHVEWEIQLDQISNPLLFPLPYFRYEMSKVFDIPVPFSSIAEEIEIQIHKVEISGISDLTFKTEKKFKGKHFIEITNNIQAITKPVTLSVQYTIKKLITRDRVYFSFVYSVSSPFEQEISIDPLPWCVSSRTSLNNESFGAWRHAPRRTHFCGHTPRRRRFFNTSLRNFMIASFLSAGNSAI